MTAFADPIVEWRGSSDPSAPIVVLLHGRGSNEADIIGLAEHLPESDAGSITTAVRTPGGHGLSDSALHDLQDWLTAVLADLEPSR